MKQFVNVIVDTYRASNGLGVAELHRLNRALGYWAPEMREHCFWYGQGAVWGYLDILNNYFQDNEEVKRIYNNFMNENYKPKKIEV